MSQQHPEKEPATFSDVAACFSEKEWKLLHKWQKELYQNVMKEIHQALNSLGPLIASSVFSLRAKEKEDLCPVEHQDSERRHAINQSPSDAIENADVLFTINWEENQHRMDHGDTHRRQNDCLSAGFPSFKADNVLRMEPDLNASLMANLSAKGGESNIDPSSGDVAITQILSISIKEEGDHYSLDQQSSERRQGIIIPTAGKACLTPVVSFSIKEEEGESMSMDHLGSKRRGCISNPAGDPVVASVLSQSILHKEERHVREEQDAEGRNTGIEHRYRYNRRNKEDCMETLKPIEALPRMDKEKVLQHSWKRETVKRPKDSKKTMQNSAGNRPIKSLECERGVSNSEKSTEKQRAQTKNRRYPCTECGKSFTCNSNLFTHLRTHTGEKPYTCSYCGKCFSQSSNLFTHHRMHTGVKPYTCSECGKRYRDSSTLVSHQRIHTGETPYICSECGKCFRWSSSLITHQHIHMGVKPYTCSECGMCFSQSSALIGHQLKHTRVKLDT